VLSTYETPPAAPHGHTHIQRIVTPACNSAQSPTDGRCLRLGDDGRCSLVRPRLVCPFAGRGAGVCGWHSVEGGQDRAAVAVEVERPAAVEIPAEIPEDGRRRCRCGADLGARRRLCDSCRETRRRDADKAEHRLWRERRRQPGAVENPPRLCTGAGRPATFGVSPDLGDGQVPQTAFQYINCMTALPRASASTAIGPRSHGGKRPGEAASREEGRGVEGVVEVERGGGHVEGSPVEGIEGGRGRTGTLSAGKPHHAPLPDSMGLHKASARVPIRGGGGGFHAQISCANLKFAKFAEFAKKGGLAGKSERVDFRSPNGST